MRKIYSLLAAATFLLTSYGAKAQCDPVMLHDSMQFVVNGHVFCTETVGNTLYFGGSFTLIGQNTGHFIGLDTVTGHTIHRNTWPQVNGNVYKVINDGSGGWIIGGTFSKVGDSVRNNIAQIDVNGHVTSFNPNANNTVRGLFINGTTLYAGGSFTNIGGSTRNRIAALNLATGVATSWNPNANGIVDEFYIYGTRLYVGGEFTLMGGLTRNYLAVVNATTGSTTTWDANLNLSSGNSVRTITSDAGKLYIGGRFDMVGSDSRYNIAAIDTATMSATTWNPSANGEVNKIIINATTAYVGGLFDNIGAVTRRGVGEVNLTTGLSTAFNPSTSMYTSVSDILVAGNKMFIGGTFSNISGIEKYNIACINLPSGSLSSWVGDADNSVYTLSMSNGKLYAGGAFSMMGSKHRNYAAAIDMAADSITAWNPDVNTYVTAMAASTTDMYIGGGFSGVGGASHDCIASVNLTSGAVNAGFYGNAFIGYLGNPAVIRSMVYYNGLLYIGGHFDHVSSNDRNNIAAVSGITGLVASWNPNPSLSYGYLLGVNKLLRNGSTIYLGGTFSSVTVGGAVRTNFVALDATTGNATSWNPNPDGQITGLTLNNGSLYFGGEFNTIGGVFAPRLARINLATLTTNTWNPFPNAFVKTIKPFQNIAFIAGEFTSVNGSSRSFITSVDTISNTPGTFNPAPGYSSYNTVNDIAIYGSKMYIVGGFYGISGQTDYNYFTGYNIRAIADSIGITGNSTVCAGTPVTYTSATNVTGGTYRWRVNGVAAGTGSNYTYVPANGDQVRCTGYIPTGSCYTTDSAQSNVITMTVNPMVTPTVTITGPSNVCAGTAISDTANTSIAGGTYQWQVNGVNTGTSNIYGYTPANGDHINCTFTPPVGCFSPLVAFSNTVTMTVNPNLDPLTSVTTPLTTVCAGTPVAYHAHGITGLHYQWKVNGANVGLDDSTYTYVPVNSDSIKCVVTAPAGGCYINTPDSSLNIGMTVIADTIPVVTITGNSILCAGVADTFHLTSNVTGGTYRWYVNGVTTSGATSTAYNYTPANGDNVKCILTVPGIGCYLPSLDTSNIINMTVNVNVAPLTSITADATTLCAGTAVHLNCLTNITGAGHQWYVNGFAAGAGAATYNYVPVNGDLVLCIVAAPVGSCYTQTTDTSNSISLIVNPIIIPTILINGPGTMAPGGTVNITATVANAGASYLITWYKNGVVFNTSSVPSASYVKDLGMIDTITAKIVSMSAGCYDSVNANTIYVYGSLGVNDVANNGGVAAYPNPFSNTITINGLADNDRIIIYDIMGRKVHESISTGNNEQTISINDVAPGTYMLHVTTNDGTPKANIVLQKQ